MKNDNTPIVIFKNVHIIDGSGSDPIYGGTVVVKGKHICEIIEGKPGVSPASATVIDGNGSLEAGIRTIEHGNLLTQNAADMIKEKNAILVPTMAAYEITAREGRSLGIPEPLLKKIGQAREKAQEALSIAYSSGCTIGSGSDLLGPMQRYRAHELTLKSRVLGPMKTLTAATQTNAAIIGREHELGTIAVGKLADLILVDGDPVEDIAILEDYKKRICLVMQGGRIHKHKK